MSAPVFTGITASTTQPFWRKDGRDIVYRVGWRAQVG
jgi:hypothetical protein